MYKTFVSACIWLIILSICSILQADTIQIRFDQLHEIVKSTSPELKILQQEYEIVKAQRSSDMKWSNPVIAYDREKVDDSKEYQITVGKTFALPWAYFNKRSAWNYRLESSKLQYDHNVARLLSEIKGDYVRIKLYDQYLFRLGELQKIIINTSEVANLRHSEGHMSGVDRHLIQMVLISLQTSHQAAIQEQRQAINLWQTRLGLVAGDKAELVTDIDYSAVDIQSLDIYVSLLEQNPEYLSYNLKAKSLDKFASAARSGFLPEISVYGGYKKIDPDYDGHVLGVSLSIPLFNRNGAEARRFMTEKNIVDNETMLLKNQLHNRSKNLIQSIKESQLLLKVFDEHVDEELESLESLLFSYEEGWIDLNDLLNTIQIEVSALENYYDHLVSYYSNIFELETIIGKTLITFEE